MPALLNKLMAAGIGPGLAYAFGNDLLDSQTALGTNQATALQTNSAVVRFTTVASGTGCILSSQSQGDSQIIVNDGANTLSVYPPSGHLINGGAANAAYSLGAGSWAYFDRISSTRWLGSSDDSANITFLPSGTGGLSRTVSAKLADLVSTADYNTLANYNTAKALLTGSIAVPATFQIIGVSGNAGLIGRGNQTFNSTLDQMTVLGYNAAIDGASIPDATDSSAALMFESNYNDGSIRHIETHIDLAGPAQSYKRPFSAVYDLTGASANKISNVSLTSDVAMTLSASVTGTMTLTALTFTVGTSGATFTLTGKMIIGDRLLITGTSDDTTSQVQLGAGNANATDTAVVRFRNGGFGTTPANANSSFNGDKNIYWNGATWKAATGIDDAFGHWFESHAPSGPAGAGFRWYGGIAANVAKQMELLSGGDFYTRANGTELATNTTLGFVHIPSCNGAPSGTPTVVTGAVPMIWDRANLQLYFYTGSAWKKSAVFT